jgi:hypothetical protein
MEKDLKNKGLNVDKKYLFETAVQAEKTKRKKKKTRQETYGWDVFNTDSLFKAYEKRVKKLPGEELATDKSKLVDHMAKEVEERIEKRNVFSRRRAFNDEKDVSSINERNRRFNEKLERNYGKYASEIKSNLDRGTAL